MSNNMMVKALEDKITKYAQMYYTDGSSPISDSEFDKLVSDLRAICPESEILKKTGWGYDVKADTTYGNKCPHKYGLIGSLDKCHDWNELSKQLKSANSLSVSLKLDGISVVLYYNKGVLNQALTRGDGIVGIDVTDKVLKIDPTLLSINDSSFTGGVRGEILMSYKDFESFKEIHPEAKNPRNSVAGLINQKELSEDLKYVQIKVYTVIGSDRHMFVETSEMIEWIENRFRNLAPYCRSCLFTDSQFIPFMNNLKDMWYGNVPADGIVITSNRIWYDISTNEVSYDAQAFKYPSESKTTTVVDVEWNMSKSGACVPRVKFDTIELAGTNVQYATGFNVKFIEDNKIGKGSEIVVTKANEIIPYIEEVKSAGEMNIPERCPHCNESLIRDGVILRCTNPQCSNSNWQDIFVWIKNIVNEDGLGDLMIKNFLEDEFKREDITIEDIMSYSYTDSGIRDGHEGLKNVLFDSLNKRKISLVSALKALNIPRLGDKTSEEFAKYPELIVGVLNSDDIQKFEQIKSKIGNANGQSIQKNIKKFRRLKLIFDRIIWDTEPNVEVKGKVAITGKLSKPRKDLEKDLKSLGYTVGDVSADCICLICNEPSTSSKYLKAQKLGISILTEEEFINSF